MMRSATDLKTWKYVDELRNASRMRSGRIVKGESS
jgi:hypothetical protein